MDWYQKLCFSTKQYQWLCAGLCVVSLLLTPYTHGLLQDSISSTNAVQSCIRTTDILYFFFQPRGSFMSPYLSIIWRNNQDCLRVSLPPLLRPIVIDFLHTCHHLLHFSLIVVRSAVWFQHLMTLRHIEGQGDLLRHISLVRKALEVLRATIVHLGTRDNQISSVTLIALFFIIIMH